jgi:hypothetical protein
MTDAIQAQVFFGKNKFTVSGLLCRSFKRYLFYSFQTASHQHPTSGKNIYQSSSLMLLVSLLSTALAKMVNFHSEDLDSKHWFISR